MFNKIKVYYSDYMIGKNNSFSPSSSKPALVIKDWKEKFAYDFLQMNFFPIAKEELYLCHDKKYVDGIFNGTVENGFGLKDTQFASTFLYTNSCLYYAAKDALKNKVAISPTSGFHHASYDKAQGFCTFNGLVWTAMKLHLENSSVKKVGILDFDMHYGNGTQDIINKLSLDYIVHYTAGRKYDLNFPALEFLKPMVKNIYHRMLKKSKENNQTPQPKLRQWYLRGKGNQFIKEIPFILESFKDCDIIIYQAGADQHINDPYGGLLTYEQMELRDKMVFEFANKNNIPIVWNLAGGYQRDANESIEPVLKCHRQTMQTCIEVFGKN